MATVFFEEKASIRLGTAMSIWQRIKAIWSKEKTQSSAIVLESAGSVADRLDRYADRCRNAGDPSGERDARIAARAARAAVTLERALQHEQDLYLQHGLRPDGRTERPVVGQKNGHDYIRLGQQVRIGGSKSWRYNNPGYVRCNDHTNVYNAIGCDGIFAIFRTEQEGLAALSQSFRIEHATKSVEQAIRDQLQSMNVDPLLSRLHKNGIVPSDRVQDLSDQSLNSVGNLIRDHGDWESGQIYERGGFESSRESAPAWVQDVWNEPTPNPHPQSSTGTASGTSPNDNR